MLCTAPVLEYPRFDEPFIITTDVSNVALGAVLSQGEIGKDYVYGNKFTIVTDHKPLLWLKSADNNTRVQKWKLKRSDYEFDIVYISGKQNANADALARNPVEIFVITRAQNKQILNKNSEQPRIPSNDDKIKIMNEDRQKIKGKRGRARKNNEKK